MKVAGFACRRSSIIRWPNTSTWPMPSTDCEVKSGASSKLKHIWYTEPMGKHRTCAQSQAPNCLPDRGNLQDYYDGNEPVSCYLVIGFIAHTNQATHHL